MRVSSLSLYHDSFFDECCAPRIIIPNFCSLLRPLQHTCIYSFAFFFSLLAFWSCNLTASPLWSAFCSYFVIIVSDLLELWNPYHIIPWQDAGSRNVNMMGSSFRSFCTADSSWIVITIATLDSPSDLSWELDGGVNGCFQMLFVDWILALPLPQLHRLQASMWFLILLAFLSHVANQSSSLVGCLFMLFF